MKNKRIIASLLGVIITIFVMINFAQSESARNDATKDAELQSGDSSREMIQGAVSLGTGPLVELTINGPINPVSADYIAKGIKHAEETDARAFILKLNTPGGLLPSMQSIVELFLQSKVPVIVYVSPSGGGAISAGVFIAMAANVAVMAPGTTIGAAHPVQSGGQDVGEDMRGKVENFAASMVKAIAEQRGRNVEWAEKAVRESVALTDSEALAQNVIDLVSPDLDSLLKSIEGREVKTAAGMVTLRSISSHPRESFHMTFQQKIIDKISDPNIAALLGLGAAGGILAEFYNPGLIVPGLFGVICLILSLVAMQVIPINAGGLLLLLLGVILITAELFIPSFGILGIAGLICFVLGSIYAIDTSLIWAADGFQLNSLLVGGIAQVVGLLLLGMVFFAASSRRLKTLGAKEGMIGQKGRATNDFRKDSTGNRIVGSIRVMGEIWKAELVEGDLPVEKNTQLEVLEVEGLNLKVRKD